MKLKQALRIVNKHGLEMVGNQNCGLTAVAVGAKNGSLAGTQDFVIRGFVKKKLRTGDLSRLGVRSFGSVVAKYTTSLSECEDIDVEDTDVVETGSEFRAMQQQTMTSPPGPPNDSRLQQRFKSVHLGIGISNPVDAYPLRRDVGTLGFCLRDTNGNYFLVSNNHVIGRLNKAAKGEPVVHPGTADLSHTDLRSMLTISDLSVNLEIAQLEWFKPLDFAALDQISLRACIKRSLHA